MTPSRLPTARSTSGTPLDLDAFARAGGILQLDGHTLPAPEASGEVRADSLVTVKSTDRDGMRAIFGGEPSASGVRVTQDGAMRIGAVHACVRVLAEDVASLPLKLYRRTAKGREVARDHPLWSVLQVRGNEVMTAMKLREVMMVHLTLWGNFFGEIIRDGRGRVVAIWPIHPARVQVRLVKVRKRPQLRFDVHNPGGGSVELTQDDVLFIPGLGTGIVGRSPIDLHREGLGVAVQAQRYGARFFANDARPGLVLKHPDKLGDVAYERLKKSWEKRHKGANNASKAAILEEGMSAETLGMPPDDAQFIETRTYEAREVYGIFRVPPHKAGDLERATFSNIEHLQIQYVTDSLRAWLVRIEQHVSVALLDESERAEYYAEHLVDALLRGDIKSRYEAYGMARNMGVMSANDVRELENLNRIPNGDIYLQPLNMVEAGSDPLAASGDDLDMDDDDPDARGVLARGPVVPRKNIRQRTETRALPERYREAKALETVFRDALRRVVDREVRELRGAVDDFLGDDADVDAFTDWVIDFADEHEGWSARRMGPAYQAMADAMIEAARGELGEDLDDDALDDFVREYVAAFAKRHAGSTRGQILGLVEEAEDGSEAEVVEERLAEWEETRAKKQARRERQRSSNAFTRAAWAVVGVATLTWRSVGKSCPICDEMDGRTSRIASSFVDKGDSVGGLDVSSRVSHPPIHDGCDCILMPGSGSRQRPSTAELRSILNGMLEEVGGRPLAARRAKDRAPEPTSTWAQRRNARIRERYLDQIGSRHGERDVIIEELRTGEFEGRPYSLAFSTCRKACDGDKG